MPALPRLSTWIVGALVGTALWLSRGVLDQVATDERAVRLALLPRGHVWLAFTLVVALGLLALHRAATHPRRGTHAPRAAFGPLLWPLWGAGVLVVPYLPWIADAWPAWQIPAGPARTIVWLLLAGQVLWVLWQEGLMRVRALARRTLPELTALVWIATAALAGAAAARLTPGPLFPGGDEPHYLVIAQSLWRDRDLKIENNHARGDYLEYYPLELAPHYQTRGVDGEIYSIHPIGMPLVVAPVYALGGYPLVVALFVAVAAASAAWLWRVTVLAVGSAGAATFGWSALLASAPFLLNTFTIYPEVLAGLAVVAAFATTALAPPGAPGRWLTAGAAVAALPWLSAKYAPLSAALAAVVLGRIWRPPDPPPGSERPAATTRDRAIASAWVVAPYAASLAGWFAFFHAIWGSPWPQASYAEAGQTSLAWLPAGLGGLFFDQEYGVLPVAPVLALGLIGLGTMAWHGGRRRRLALEIAVVIGAHVCTVGAFHHWWGGASVVGRNLMAVLLLLMVPLAVQFDSAPPGSPRRAAQHLLLWASGAVTLTLAAAQEGLLLAQARDGSAALLEYLSPRWELWAVLPTFIHHEASTAWLRALAWVAVAAAAALVLARLPPRSAGASSLAALAVAIAALVAGTLLALRLPGDAPPPRVDLGARARLAALDAFDATVRPLAVVYDPFRLARAPEIVPRLGLAVAAGQRTDPQPLRVIHNGRFSLPAGTYEVEIAWADRTPLPVRGPSPVGIQIGRTGPPWRVWQVDPAPGVRVRERVRLDLDAPFFGLRGSLDVERAIARIAVQPVAVVDAGARPRAPAVLGAAAYGRVTAYFHDEQVHPEPGGFWTRAGRRAVVTLSAGEPHPFVLRLHSGHGTTRVVLGVRDWSHAVDLAPGLTEEVALPDFGTRTLTVSLDTEGGFVPAEIVPGSDDPRRLGAWVEVIAEP